MPPQDPWIEGAQAQQARLRREITPWEPISQPTETQSTYSSHYQKWPVQVRSRATKPPDERPMSASRFDTRSTMQDSFQNWSGLPSRLPSCRPTSAYVAQQWMQPISTTHREAFQQWRAQPRTSLKPKNPRDVSVEYAPTGRSTMQDSYQPIPATATRVKSAAPVERPLDKTVFEGTTTMRSAYQPWPVQPRHKTGKKTESNPWSGADPMPFPNSTYRDMFREIVIPKGGRQAVGLQVAGGKFYTMLQRGTFPPAEKKVMMTTTTDKQGSLDIVVVISPDEANKRGKVVGEFTLDGIAPARAGIPQIQVCFVLSNDNSLRVSAVDIQGNRTRALSVQEKVRLA